MLDLIKNEKIDGFNESVKEKLTILALDAVQVAKETMQETKLDKRVLFIREMFDFLGLDNVEVEDDEISATTAHMNVVRLADEQLQETHVDYIIEVVSGLDEISEFDSDFYSDDEENREELDLDDYIAQPNDLFVITVFTESLFEGSNPFKRSSQKVIRGGKRVRKLIKNKKKGFKRGSDGKTRKQTSSEKIRRKRGTRKAVRTNKGKKAQRVRKFKRSIKKTRKINNRAKRRA